jgi:hypothetical protein
MRKKKYGPNAHYNAYEIAIVYFHVFIFNAYEISIV